MLRGMSVSYHLQVQAVPSSQNCRVPQQIIDHGRQTGKSARSTDSVMRFYCWPKSGALMTIRTREKGAVLKHPPQSFRGSEDSIRADAVLDRPDAGWFQMVSPSWRLGWSDAAFLVAMVLVCGLSTFVGVASPLDTFAHDTLFFLANAYRVAQGQVPHQDFSSAWGPMMFLIHAAGLWLSGMRPTAFGYANALFGALIALWAFLIARPRWAPSIACAVGVYTLLLITAPFPIGIDPTEFGYAMSYNRYGYALFGIIMIECARNAPSRRNGNQQRIGGAVSTGVALAMLFFLKISYAFVALPFVVVLAIVGGTARLRRLIGLGGGFAIFALIVMWYLRFDFPDMLEDLAMAATARRMSLYILHPLGAARYIPRCYCPDFRCWFDYSMKAGGERIARLHGALFAIMSLGAGYSLLMSNQQISTFPLNGYAAVALVAAYQPLLAGRLLQWPGAFRVLPGALLLAVCILPFSLANAMSLASAAMERQWPADANIIALELPERGTSLRFRLLTGERQTETGGAGYVAALNDGMDLLRRRPEHTTVFLRLMSSTRSTTFSIVPHPAGVLPRPHTSTSSAIPPIPPPSGFSATRHT